MSRISQIIYNCCFIASFHSQLSPYLSREEPDKQMTLVFDCAGSGMKNIDLDNMQFMINSFKEDYPWCLNYILVYEMPWVMNGTGTL